MNSVSATSIHFPSLQQWSPIGILAGGIFVIDLFMPLGVAIGVFYLAVILLSLRHHNSQLSMWTAVGCSILTIIAFILSPVGGELWKVLLNRGLALFVIWTTTLMARYQILQTETIKNRDQTLLHFLKTMPIACYSFDRHGTILSWNPAAEKIYGYAEQEAIGASSYDLLSTPRTVEKTKTNYAKIFQGDTVIDQIWQNQNKKGQSVWRRESLFPVVEQDGQVAYGINFNIDITAQKSAESELLQKNSLLEAILHSTQDAIYAKDLSGKYLLANQAAADVMGKAAEALTGLDDIQIFGPNYGKTIQETDANIMAKGQFAQMEETFEKQEKSITFSTTKSPLKASNGKTIGLVGISRDITEWKNIQKDLLLTERVFQASHDHISIVGQDYRYRRVNPSYEKIHGLKSQEVVGMYVSELLGNDIFEHIVKPKLDQCFQGKEIHYESWFRFTEDRDHYLTVSYLPLMSEDNNIEEIVVIARNLTDRKKSEEALMRSEQRHRALVQSAPFCIHEIDVHGQILSMNTTGQKMVGVQTETEIVGHSYLELVEERDYERVKECFAEALLGKIIDFEFQVTKNGISHTYAKSFTPVRNTHDQMISVMGIAEDITDRKYAEEKIIQNEQQLRTILDAMTNFIGIGSVEGIVKDCNQAPLDMAGLTREEVIGKFFVDTYWLNYSPKVQQQVHEIIQRVAQGEIVREDYQARMGENLIVTVDACFVPVKDTNGQVQQIVHSGIDVTNRRQAEDALRVSEDQFRDLYESAPLAYFSVSFDGHITRVNGRATELLGYSLKEFIGKHVLTLYAETKDGYNKAITIQKRTQEGSSIQDEELEMLKKDGTILWVSLTVRLIFDESGKIIERRGMIQDISHRKRIENELRNTEYRFRSLVETAGSIIIGLTPDGWIVEWNREAERLFGQTREEALDKNYFEAFIPESDSLQMLADTKMVLEGTPTRDFENVILDTHGTRHHILWNVDRLLNENQQPYGIICIGRDITQWKLDEETFRQQALMFNTVHDGILVTDLNGVITDWNPGAELMFGYSKQEALGSTPALVHEPSENPTLTQSILDELSQKGRWQGEINFRRKDGRSGICETIAAPLKNLDGQLIGTIGVNRDITERKSIEATFLNIVRGVSRTTGEKFFSSFVEHLTKALNVDYAYVGQIIEKEVPTIETIAVFGKGNHLDNFEYSLSHTPCENVTTYDFCAYPHDVCQHFPKDVLLKELEIQGYAGLPLYDSNKQALGLVVVLNQQPLHNLRSIESTMKIFAARAEAELERTHVERALQESEERLYLTLEATTTGTWDWNVQTGKVIFGQEWLKSLGYHSHDLLPTVDSWRAIVHPEDFPHVQDALNRHLAKETEIYESINRLRKKNGEWRWNLDRGRVVEWTEDGKPIRMVGTDTDITEQKNLEEAIRKHNEELEMKIEKRTVRIQELEQRRMQVEKLAALAQIAAGVAHEINNPLASISQSLELLKRAISTDHPHFRYIGKTEDCIQRIAIITKKLYQLYRPSEPMAAPVDLRMCIRIATEIMEERALQNRVRIAVPSFSKPIMIQVSQGELVQILCNLLHNAIDASPQQCTIEISLTIGPKSLTLFVADRGEGIPPEVRPHIFEPFYTTKYNRTEGGMGLGLSISHSLVESMGGTLDFSTAMGQGSTFTITLPANSLNDGGSHETSGNDFIGG